MMKLLMLFGLALCGFAICFAAMAIGLILRGRKMRGGCGSEPQIDEEGRLASCGSCPKKPVSLCESEDSMGTAAIAELGTLGRYREGS